MKNLIVKTEVEVERNQVFLDSNANQYVEYDLRINSVGEREDVISRKFGPNIRIGVDLQIILGLKHKDRVVINMFFNKNRDKIIVHITKVLEFEGSHNAIIYHPINETHERVLKGKNPSKYMRIHEIKNIDEEIAETIKSLLERHKWVLIPKIYAFQNKVATAIFFEIDLT